MTQISIISMRLLLVASVVAQAENAAAKGPRAAYVCQAMIANQRSDRTVQGTEDPAIQRMSKMLGRSLQNLSVREKIMKTGEARRLWTDIATLKAGRFAVRQELTGAPSIRAYLDAVEKDSRKLESDHDAVAAKQPFRMGPLLKIDSAYAAIASVITLGIGYGTTELYNHHHQVVAVAGAVAVYKVIRHGVMPYVTNVVRGIRNVLTLRSFAKGRGVGNGQTTADFRAEEFDVAVNDIRRMLSQPAESRNLSLWMSTRVSLPLSRSAADFNASTRLAPTAAQIEAAVNESGDFPLPADARALDVDLVFYFDPELKQPVLTTFIRDRAKY